MGIAILERSGTLLTFEISGELLRSELDAAHKAAIDVINSEGSIRLLVITKDFLGWETGVDWGDVSFQINYDQYIQKIAIVGAEKWEDLVSAFTGKGLRSAPVEYFTPTEIRKARKWIEENPDPTVQ